MGIMDKIQGLFSKGKDGVSKTTGGDQSAQTAAPAQDVAAPATDAGSAAAAEPGTETPVEPTSEA
jgi:hypothetical protein